MRVATRALIRPRLLLLLFSTAWRFRRRGWYRQPPFLPVPPADYMRWRLHTAFGDGAQTPSVTELESYLRWAAHMRAREPVGEDE